MGQKSGLKFFFLLSVAMLMNAFIMGCTQNNTTGDVTLPSNKGSESPVIAASQAHTISASPKAEIKTGDDKIKETIALAVADGAYSGDVTYAYHSGQETVTFGVTVKDDVITAVSVTPHNPAKYSERIISGFSAALPDLVVGKKITELNLPKNVGGSSLTNAAFKGYIEKLIATK